MKVSSYLYSAGNELLLDSRNGITDDKKCQLVLGFGGKDLLARNSTFNFVREKFLNAQILLATTAGEIFDTEVLDDTLSLVAIEFEKTNIHTVCININNFADSYLAGAALIKQMPQESLRHVFVLSDGGLVNGSELVRGINSIIDSHVSISGGLAGDGANFKSTLVGLNQQPAIGNIVAAGFYGDSVKVSHGSMGGWDVFGLERTVTKSEANRLYEIDGKNALALYREYLGRYADELPGSALLFPLSVKLKSGVGDAEVVRTILSIDERSKAMVFAGDIPPGSKIRFMKANFDKLIDAAVLAANSSKGHPSPDSQKVSILISCVGRKLILGKRVDEEVEAVRDTLGGHVILTGFYSYGEISPHQQNTKCELHNQTMTITTFEEI
jgi:hypothetical protein